MRLSWLRHIVNQVIIWSITVPSAIAGGYLVVSLTQFAREHFPNLHFLA